MIPKGLPGEGNILVFDNGGFGGYGAPNPGSTTGHNNALRDYSRILEFDPVTLEIIWQYTYLEAGALNKMCQYNFYSPLISSAQRLPNGNTFITEGSGGRIIEVTPDHKIVWEYISPYYSENDNSNYVYRAYRVPYEWVPQLELPKETPVEPVDNSKYRVPGSEYKPEQRITKVEGAKGFSKVSQLCVIDTED
jgi:hypothetical protein